MLDTDNERFILCGFRCFRCMPKNTTYHRGDPLEKGAFVELKLRGGAAS